MNLEERQEKVLMFLLREFIAHPEPVGSKLLCHKYQLDCSSATVRNVMSNLESQGFLYQLHFSGGRIPAPKAYRYYVNKLMQSDLQPEKAIKEQLTQDTKVSSLHEFNELVEYAAEIMANLTRYTSLVLVPRAQKSLLRYLSFEIIDENTVMLVVLTTTGYIATRIVKLTSPVDGEKIHQLARFLNEKLEGRQLSGVGDLMLGQILSEAEYLRINQEFFHTLSQAARNIASQAENKVISCGKDRLFDSPEFQNLSKLRGMMKLLEEEQIVAEILSQSLEDNGVQVKIGDELTAKEISECAIITAPYTDGDETVGSLGILGPLRMPYEQLIPAVRLVAEVFSHRLSILKDE